MMPGRARAGWRSRTSRWATRSWRVPVAAQGRGVGGRAARARSQSGWRSRRAREAHGLGDTEATALPDGRDSLPVAGLADGSSRRARVGGERGAASATTRADDAARPRATGSPSLWVAIRREPWIFALSTLGSLLFGALTVADAWVLGWSTDHVVLPAFETARSTPACCVAVLALFLGVAILRAVGIVARRLGAGIMQYRMQAHNRRAVTRQYLALPDGVAPAAPDRRAALQRQLRRRGGLGPDRAAADGGRHRRDDGDRRRPDVRSPTWCWRWSGCWSSRPWCSPTSSTSGCASPLMTRAQELRAEVSEIAHESFDGAMVVKTLGREAEETDRFAAKAARAARRQHPRRPDPRRLRPDPRRAAQPRRPRRARRRRQPGAQRRTPTPATWSPSPTCSPSCPSRSARSAGCSASSRAAWSATDRVRAVLAATGEMPYGDRALPDRGGARRPARGRAPRLRLRARPATLLDGRHLHRRARAAPSRSSAPPPPARARSPRC